jgi:predicted rRNA methylase YqxC with S4 and FtsJ domains
LVNIKKIKDGKVSLFKKNYKKELNIIYEKEFTKDGMDFIYKTIQYYLANTTNELVKTNLNNKNANLLFMIEPDFERNKEFYTHIGIATSHENHTQVFQWLYLNEDDELFEYDLPNDKLIKFE